MRSKFCNIQSHCASANQGAFRRQWPLPWQETQHRVALAQRLPKGRATSIVGGVAALGKGLPFPADCALPTMLVARLSVTELSTWPTRGGCHQKLQLPIWDIALPRNLSGARRDARKSAHVAQNLPEWCRKSISSPSMDYLTELTHGACQK